MPTAKIVYNGNLRTTATHLKSNTVIETDAPTDNQGKGERFSPTDLLATALGSCMMTLMGIKARDMQIDLVGTTLEVTKFMASDPRRVNEIGVHIQFPEGLNLTEKDKTVLERTARTCPVQMSIHPDINVRLTLNW